VWGGKRPMDDLPEYLRKSILIFGCGNVLFGDDGFGPIVAEELGRNYNIPENVYVLNAELSVREILFNVTLSEIRPDTIVIIDAVDFGREPGEIFEIDLDKLPENKIDDFSMHQVPTSNLLRELRDICKVHVRILSCQVQKIPKEVEPGLSDIVKEQVPKMCKLIVNDYFEKTI
jgi:coenzyme F420 hydrogenase subunit delta